MRKYFPFAIIIGLYALTLVVMGFVLQTQQLSVVKDSIEQDVAEWDILIDSLYLDSNDHPSFNEVDWAYAVLDSQSILYSSAELSNSVINDSSFAVNQWMIRNASFGIYLQKYVPKGDRFLFVEIDLNNEFLFYSRPKGTYKGKDTEKLLLDFYLINTTISPEGNKVKATINDTEFIITEWSPYYLQGLPKGEIKIKLELINSKGELVDSPFNPSIRSVTLE